MQTLIALVVAAVAASATARPPAPTAAPPASLRGQEPNFIRELPLSPPREFWGDYLLPKMMLPHYMGYVDSPEVAPLMPNNDWLSKEINHINQMEDVGDLVSPNEADLIRWYYPNAYLPNTFESPMGIEEPEYAPDPMYATNGMNKLPVTDPELLSMSGPHLHSKLGQPDHEDEISIKRKKFAFTPMDEGYYEPAPKYEIIEQFRTKAQSGYPESGAAHAAMLLEIPRQTRQNPNLNKQKHLLEPNIGNLKSGLSNEHEEGEASKQHGYLADSSAESTESFFSVALIAVVGAALTMSAVGFGFGWYTLVKRANAAADVDYPAYGVTGPSVDTSGDRKLAHSAHMYHYQHQKQQIIAMERNGLEQQHARSVSDADSEEENEEGDYTVYECPGFATTGDMEVKNPLFTEELTPVTPGKCEVVKQQPKF